MEALNKTEQLEAARALINAIEQDDDDRIKTELMALTNARESALFQQIGKLTR
ncbi:MAG: protein phosphatase CheZ, partial [Methylophaga nitratireducenticrescens]